MGATALKVQLDNATMFVDIGQFDLACQGKWDAEAHGRQVPPDQIVELYRPSCDIIGWPHALPTQPLGR